MEMTDISLAVRYYFKLVEEVHFANENLPESVPKLDRGELKNVTSTAFIQSYRDEAHKMLDLPEKDGYHEPSESSSRQTKPPQGKSNWDGSKYPSFGKHMWREKPDIEKEEEPLKFKDIDLDYLKWMSSTNKVPYPNQAQFELDRRGKNPLSEEDFSQDLTDSDIPN